MAAGDNPRISRETLTVMNMSVLHPYAVLLKKLIDDTRGDGYAIKRSGNMGGPRGENNSISDRRPQKP